ncbi:precorrin-3B synthase [Granulosicoccus antarcticus]|uniref:Nitrite/Sulfite reductase ferredoxin-like domain-containing protein n=1 Tax=Granulosicoccus antarcticus IMCC3135 TaxID=1192854 RepID=A0A2Z2NL64_9GAMM|nr:precorrin-3B synthase [Granulosicoccus antarcticus]ASJ71883.1 hypothetical protein IMCC3135_08930 [Granulosicoccus antarcticus IMCC3135]
MDASNKPLIHGACPGALQPMAAADGLIVRIRPPYARLSQPQAIALGELAQEYGIGQISLTSRANLQMRGIRASEHAALIKSLMKLDLVDVSIDSERRRNLVFTPFWIDGDVSHQVGARLIQALDKPGAPTLPAKFGFAVDCGATPVLTGTSADIRIQHSADGELMCLADGMGSGARVSIATAADTAMRLAHWFLDHEGAPQGRGRMASFLASGATLPAEFHEVLAAPGLACRPEPGKHAQGWLVAPEFGLLKSEDLYTLAPLGNLRLTPWRMILIEGVGDGAAAGVGLRAGDPRLNVFACTGAPGCAQAHSSTLGIARSLAAQLAHGERLHVAGCIKGCAHPSSAAITLVATAPDEYKLIRNGKACDQPVRVGLRAEQITSTPEYLLDFPENGA